MTINWLEIEGNTRQELSDTLSSRAGVKQLVDYWITL